MRRVWISGGFAPTPTRNVVEDRAIAGLGPTRRVCFLGAASGDDKREIDRFYQAFADVEPSHVSLYRRRRGDVERIAEADLIVLGGGNPANLRALLPVHDLEETILDAYQRGATLLGVSAGASVLFESFLTDSFGPPLRASEGLGVLAGSFCPHASRTKRRARYAQCVGEGMAGGLGVGDDAYAGFEDEVLGVVVGDVVRVHRVDSRAQVTALEPT